MRVKNIKLISFGKYKLFLTVKSWWFSKKKKYSLVVVK